MKKTLYLLATVALMGFSACSSDDDKISLPDITVDMASSETGIGSDGTSGNVTINLSRQADVDISIDVVVSSSDSIIYGEDYITTPATENKVIKLTIPAGSLTGSIKVEKLNNEKLSIADSLNFKISTLSQGEGFSIGQKSKSSFFFGEISSKGDLLTLNGRDGNDIYKNSVYVDFSKNSQTAVDRKSWNLAFYNGNDFRVVLNGADATTAVASNKTDINAVTIEDANAAYNIGLSPMNFDEALSFDVVDTFDGALSGTVFAPISANDSENKVYFVAPENNKENRSNWYKVKVDRKGNGYKVQYAKVGETNIKTVEVTKNPAYNFSFLSFAKGSTVNVEPEAKTWSIMWGYNTIGIWDRPYFAQDVVVINNIAGVEAAQVDISKTVTYTSFTKADISSIKLSSDKNVISTNWRNTSSFGGKKVGVYTDRFYVIKDPNGNYYKLRFLKMGESNDGGVRGRPVIEYALLK